MPPTPLPPFPYPRPVDHFPDSSNKVYGMTNCSRFTYAVASPSTRRDIALAVRDGIPADQLAAEFDISESTVRSYAAEWEGVQRRIRALDPWEREGIIHACGRGGRRRWERELGVDVVRELLGEE